MSMDCGFLADGFVLGMRALCLALVASGAGFC